MGWVERFSCQSSVRPHFSSPQCRVPLASANIWLWLICQGWLYNGNGEMDCQLQLVLSRTAWQTTTFLQGWQPRAHGFSLGTCLKCVLRWGRGQRELIFLFTTFPDTFLLCPGLLGQHHRRASHSEVCFLSCGFNMLCTSNWSLNSTNERCERVYFILHTGKAQREAYLWLLLRCSKHANDRQRQACHGFSFISKRQYSISHW